MDPLEHVAPGFVALAHEVVYATIGTVDAGGRPRSRIMHPIWEWDGERLTGWVGTSPSPKLAHLERVPHVSVAYVRGWAAEAVAECRAARDDAARERVWGLFAAAEPPLGFDPGGIGVPGWDAPDAPGFVVLRFEPYRVRTRTFAPPDPPDVRTWRATG
jgi:hypothetical protein